VIHSQKDYRLDVSEGFQLFTALQRLGVPSRMLYFPDEGHWVLKPQNSQLWYREVGNWCDRWTKASEYGVSGTEVPMVAPAAPAPAVMGKVQEQPKVLAPVAASPEVRAPAAPQASAGQSQAKVQTAPAAAVAVPSVATAASPKASTTAQVPQAGASFVITISAPEDEVQVGTDARVVITLKNISDRQVLVGRHSGVDSPEFTYRIEVRNALGQTVEATAYARGVRPESGINTVDYVQPGGIAVQTAHVAKLVNLRRPGRYTVQVSRRDPKSGLVVKSNEITLSVVP
jgi:hypothetical protein